MRSDASVWLKGAAWAVVAFLHVPLALIVLYAFSAEDKSYVFPPPALTTQWFGVAWQREDVWAAIRMSFEVALWSTGIAIVLGSFVEPLEINFMVGQAFAIAAASYFPLLFMSVWWRGMTMAGAATGMLTGGLSALAAASTRRPVSMLRRAPRPSATMPKTRPSDRGRRARRIGSSAPKLASSIASARRARSAFASSA